MIPVQTIYNRVAKDLSRKHMTGYSSAEEFTRDLADSESILFEFYYAQFQKNGKFTDALLPFVVENYLQVTDYIFDKPDNYRHFVEAAFDYIEADCCDDIKRRPIPTFLVDGNQERYISTSYIRKPTAAKGQFFYSWVNDKGRLISDKPNGKLFFKYLRQPVNGVYAATINQTLQIEEYDAVNSVNLEWPAQEATQIINLMLLHKGISVATTDLIQFATQKFGLETNAGR